MKKTSLYKNRHCEPLKEAWQSILVIKLIPILFVSLCFCYSPLFANEETNDEQTKTDTLADERKHKSSFPES